MADQQVDQSRPSTPDVSNPRAWSAAAPEAPGTLSPAPVPHRQQAVLDRNVNGAARKIPATAPYAETLVPQRPASASQFYNQTSLQQAGAPGCTTSGTPGGVRARGSPYYWFFWFHRALGGDESPACWQWFHTLVLLTMGVLLAWTGAVSVHSATQISLADNKDPQLEKFTAVWLVVCFVDGLGISYLKRCAFKNLHSEIQYGSAAEFGAFGEVLTGGQITRIILEVNPITEGAGGLMFWLSKGLWLIMVPACLFSCQMFIWIGWLIDVCRKDNAFECIGWTSFEVLVLPLAAFHIGYFIVAVAVAHHAVSAMCKDLVASINQRARVQDERQQVELANDVMDKLHNLNANLIPALATGWSSPLGGAVFMLTLNSLCFVWKVFNVNYSIQYDTDAAASTAQFFDNVCAFGLMLFAAGILIFPAQASTECTKILTHVNTMRCSGRTTSAVPPQHDFSTRDGAAAQEFEVSPRGRVKYEIVPNEVIARIECLSAYIKEANGGKGMGCLIMGSRVNTAQVATALRLIVTAFSYIFTRAGVDHVAGSLSGVH